jgi:ubiquinone/menaquinone biosynthesis C-methylase UbiE
VPTQREVISAQFTAGLYGLGLLRSWPYLDAETAAERLAQLEHAAADPARELLDVLDTSPGYAVWAATYDTRVNPLLVAEQPTISTVLENVPPGRALDAACGTGRLTRVLLDAGHAVTAVDASDDMLSRARAVAPGATYRVASLQQLPFPDASFDVVSCGLALTHVDELRPVMNEFARVLVDGGRVITSDVHPVAVATGAHAFFRRPDGSRCVVRNAVHWHGEYLDAFADAQLRVGRCIEPRFSEEVLDAFVGRDGASALEHLIGLPCVLIWECIREQRDAG